MNRVFNFSAGPCTLPVEVLQKASEEMLDYRGSGMSVMEMSHRSKVYQQIFDETESTLRRVLSIPENYKVLLLQGGASSQFAMVPMNLKLKGKAAYLNTGAFAKKAISEAKKFLDVDVLASGEENGYSAIPDLGSAFTAQLVDGAYDYLHITSNNTIYGTRYTQLPDTKDVPLVADMSSCIASAPEDFSRYGLVYAGAQKNLGPAGVTLVIIREDLISDSPSADLPTMFSYAAHSKSGSMYNTPPCYSIYIMGLVMEWLEGLGGVEAIGKINRKKADILYDYLDSQNFYSSPVRKDARSMMNVTFVTPKPDLDAEFLKQAEAAGLMNLKGHRLVGGVRASIYNAMPVEGVNALVDIMKDFAAKKG